MSYSNPCNIEVSSSKWLGSIPSKSRFVCFEHPVYGFRAASLVLRSYFVRRKIFSLHDIIYTWAPPVENDSNTYFRFVAKEFSNDLGYIVCSSVDCAKILGAMTVMENTPACLKSIHTAITRFLDSYKSSSDRSVYDSAFSGCLRSFADIFSEYKPLSVRLFLDTINSVIEKYV